MPADTVAPAIKEREAEIARLDVKLRTPRRCRRTSSVSATPDQRAEQWRSGPAGRAAVARLLLRRLIGPLVLRRVPAGLAWVQWESAVTTGVLDGLVPTFVASPTGAGDMDHLDLALAGVTRKAA